MKRKRRDSGEKTRSRTSRPRVDADRSCCQSGGSDAVARLQRSVGNQAVQELHERERARETHSGSTSEGTTERSTRQDSGQSGERAASERAGRSSSDGTLGDRSIATTSPAPTISGGLTTRKRTSAPNGVSAIVRAGLDTPGRALERDVHQFMAERFGQDFDQVRVHTGSRAAASAEMLEAEAYTVGQHVVFGSGNYAPRTESGRELLAHELTHVVQGGPTKGRQVADVSQPSDSMEQEAERVTRAVLQQRGGNRADPEGTPREATNTNLAITQAYAPQVAREPSDETTGTKNVQMFMAPTVVVPGSEACPSDMKVLRPVINQINQHTDDKLVPALQSVRQVAGQTTMASKGAGLLEKFVGKVGQVVMWAADFVLTLGEQAAGQVANALSSDIQRIRDLLTNAEANALSGDAKAARFQIDKAYGLLTRNLYWLKYRDKRPSPEEYDVFYDCPEDE